MSPLAGACVLGHYLNLQLYTILVQHAVCVLLLQVNTLDEHEWHRLEQAHVLANVQQAFSDAGGATAETAADDIDDAMFTTGDMLSPSVGQGGSTDAHALAMMLQQQLDVINNEIR